MPVLEKTGSGLWRRLSGRPPSLWAGVPALQFILWLLHFCRVARELSLMTGNWWAAAGSGVKGMGAGEACCSSLSAQDGPQASGRLALPALTWCPLCQHTSCRAAATLLGFVTWGAQPYPSALPWDFFLFSKWEPSPQPEGTWFPGLEAKDLQTNCTQLEGPSQSPISWFNQIAVLWVPACHCGLGRSHWSQGCFPLSN